MATRTAPRDWWGEPSEVIVTALDVLEERHKAMKAASRR